MTTYYYRVEEFVTTFEADPGKNESFSHTEEFKGPDFRECRRKAYAWYNERLKGLDNKGSYHNLPFAAFKDFTTGKNAAYSVTLALVECGRSSAFGVTEDYEEEYFLAGWGEEEEQAEARELEIRLLSDNQYNPLEE